MKKTDEIKKVYNKHINSIINSTTQTHDEKLTLFAQEIEKLFIPRVIESVCPHENAYYILLDKYCPDCEKYID